MSELMKKIIEDLLPMLINLVTTAIDALIPGENLSVDQVKAVKSAYELAKIWGPAYVASTTNTMDDEGLQAFLKLCEDTLAEAEK
jgi:hypothetical protein